MKSLLAVTGLLLALVGCGKNQFTDKSDEGKNVSSSETESARETVDVSAAFGDESKSFMLADASKFRIVIEGCDSGYTKVLTEADADSSLWLWDTGCVGKLESFSVGSVDYTVLTPFTNYAVGDVAIFKGTDESTLTVTVRKQIAPDLSPNIINPLICQEIEYSFNSIEEGPGATIDPKATGVVGRVVGEKLPQLAVAKAQLLKLQSGVGVFDFKVRCLNPIMEPECLSLISADQAANGDKIEYLLVKDIYGGSLTMVQAEALPWNTALKVKAAYFGATAFLTQSLNGPGAINDAANRQMLLVLRINGSYQYFEIDVNNLPDVECKSGPTCPPPPPCPQKCPHQHQN